MENLLILFAARLVAAQKRITRVEARDRKLMLTRRNGDYILIEGKFPRLAASNPAERLREVLALLRKF